MSSALRRVLLLVMLVFAVAAAASWWRDRDGAAEDDEPPVWPPLEPVAGTGVDAAAPTPAPAAGWLPAGDGDAAPDGFPIKAKESSGIFHEPGGRFYDRTNPDRWYATADAAVADGYRRSKT